MNAQYKNENAKYMQENARLDYHGCMIQSYIYKCNGGCKFPGGTTGVCLIFVACKKDIA
jgi:hypothetical protein